MKGSRRSSDSLPTDRAGYCFQRRNWSKANLRNAPAASLPLGMRQQSAPDPLAFVRRGHHDVFDEQMIGVSDQLDQGDEFAVSVEKIDLVVRTARS